MKVGILTTFYEWSTAYSLTSVVESQLVSLKKNGYEPVLFVHDNFKKEDELKIPEGIEIRKVVPRFLLVDYSNCQSVSPKLEEEAKKVYEMLKENTKDIQVIFEHDMIFQGWFLPYCMGIHQFAKESQIKWFHWIHSVPSMMPANAEYPHTLRFNLPQNSKIVYLNNFHTIRVSEAYHTIPKNVKVVHNPLDPRLFNKLHPLVLSLLNKYPILEADFIQIYPLSTPRMVSGKGLHTVIDILSSLKSLHKDVCLIICNAHANDKREKQLIAETLSYSSQKGLNANEVIFTSTEETPQYELGVPKEVVSQLFQIANLFIFPSISENCSLILLEAMLSKNLLVLNESVGSMREFGKENALYFKFGGMDENVSYDDRDKFMLDVAKIIISEFNNNKALKAQNDIRQNYNYDSIFNRMILPLLYER